MTTPLLPYSVTWFASATVFMWTSVSQRGSWPDNYYKHRLGPGTYMLQMVYFSTGKRLTLRAVGGEDLLTIEPRQTGWLRSPMVQVTVTDGQEMFLVMLSTQAFGEDAPEKAALNVYPMEPYKP